MGAVDGKLLAVDGREGRLPPRMGAVDGEETAVSPLWVWEPPLLGAEPPLEVPEPPLLGAAVPGEVFTRIREGARVPREVSQPPKEGAHIPAEGFTRIRKGAEIPREVSVPPNEGAEPPGGGKKTSAGPSLPFQTPKYRASGGEEPLAARRPLRKRLQGEKSQCLRDSCRFIFPPDPPEAVLQACSEIVRAISPGPRILAVLKRSRFSFRPLPAPSTRRSPVIFSSP